MSYVAMSITQDFVQHMAELPAKDGVVIEGKTQSIRPESVGSFLPVRPKDDSCWS